MNTKILHPHQEAIRTKCFHSSGEFVEFPLGDVEKSIPERFEKIVEQYPERVAVKMASQMVTYADLNAMANRLAHLIVNDRGTDAEPVGLFFEKGIPLIASILAVLKAGKFFVLLDSSLPQSRLSATLGDSQARLIIADQCTGDLTGLAATSHCQLMEFNSIDSRLPTKNLALPISPTALGYIIYTSGSTGTPKGVVKTHQNQLHTVMLRTNANHICVHDRIALLPSGTANAVANTFLALLNGAALMPFDVNREEATSLAAWLAQEEISICQIATPLFRRLCETLTGKEDFSALRILRMRSEAVQKPEFLLYKDHFPSSCLFLNGLSASETSVVTEYLADHESVMAGSEVPIGYEMDGVEVLLLDDDGKTVGANHIGEMVIRSEYLAPGYWRNPELTAAKFRQDPADPAKRLYYTGDLGMMLPDGSLIHKGRKDFRVKVRGYGVELAEIERALSSHPEIKESIVLADQVESAETRLVAYFTTQHSPPSVSELRRYLEEILPNYMVPSTFVALEALPLTSNGKVDRRLLPQPDSSRPELDTRFVAPATVVEKKLAGIWAEVLSVDQIGIDDNFFDLGGHSLAAIRVVSKVIKEFQTQIPIQYFFRNPTVSALAKYLEQCPDTVVRQSETVVKRAATGTPIPLSFPQERLWFLDQLSPGDYSYNLLAAYELKGNLNINALEQSFNAIVGRHEVLRTVFRSVDGTPEQVILPPLDINISLIDLRNSASKEQQCGEVQRLAKVEAQRSFDLRCGPLLRISLLQLADDEYLLFRAMHHIVIDGWSGSVLFRELAQFYGAFLEHAPYCAPNLPAQYADFAIWQRQLLQGDALEQHLSYWRHSLENAPTLQLATDRPRPAVQTFHGAHESFVICPELTGGLQSLSRRHGVTLFMTLLAAFQTLLARYTGQTDIVVGSPIAGRNRGEIEPLIGFFLNMLALRIDLSVNPTFRELLGRTREVCLDALAHQDLPFEKLVEELHIKRDLSRHPVFQVTFGFRNTPKFSIELAGLQAKEVEVDSGIARYDMNLFMEEEEDGLRGYLNYNTDLFNVGTIQRFIGHFKNLLESVVNEPGQRLSELSIISEAEKNQLLLEWNDTEWDQPQPDCIHQLFEAQVKKSPDKTAVTFESQQLTYAELNRRANQLAHYLRRQGLASEMLVAICVERSFDSLVSLLGVLKAGGAYLPIDPNLPWERIQFMLQDSQARFLLTQGRLNELIPSFAGKRIIIDRDWSEIEREETANLDQRKSSANLAYVIYTSGSTGAPKGVMIEHRSVINLLASMAREPGLTQSDILLAVTTLSFDIAGLEIYLPLALGARIVFASRAITSDAMRLIDLLSHSGATVMQATPATWQMLLAAGWEGSPKLKIFCGGEALSERLAKELIGRCSTLWNLYGPTETTIWSAVEKITGHDGRVTIGRPIANTQIYILDPFLNTVPIGVVGELHIGGKGLARGYLNRPELTAQKFISNPFRVDLGSQLYKTGDLGRYLSDGSIEYVGRIDDQIKIRGYRVELAEIEAVLNRHPKVREAIVRMRGDDSGDRRLMAYVVASSDSLPLANELRSYLEQKLPEYMVPRTFMFLESLPLTSNGKVDRAALPEPNQYRPEIAEGYIGPRTAMEELLANIWAEILKINKVGMNDNFFEFGGHSLLATQMVSRIQNVFQLELPLRILFESPTITGLVEQIEAARREQDYARSIPLVSVPRNKSISLSFSQQRLWFLDQYEPKSSVYNISIAERLRGSLDIGAMGRSFGEIIRRHEVLRTTFSVVDEDPVQIISPAGNFTLPVIDISHFPGNEREEEARRLTIAESRLSFDLSVGPLFRVSILRLGPEDHILLVSMHHIISDRWSIGVLQRELSDLYAAFTGSMPSALSELRVQYADYAIWQREWLQGEQLARQLSYWKKQLEGAPKVLPLAFNRRGLSLPSNRGASQTLTLSKDLSQKLKALSRNTEVTLYMILLAAFQTLLYRYTGQEDIVVGSPIANRARSEIEGLIGFFVNTLVLRTRFSGNPTFRKLLHQIRTTALEAYEHQHLPFEKLVEELRPDRNLNYSPLCQVMFNMNETGDFKLNLAGLTTESLPISGDESKFDLTLYARDQGDTVRFNLVHRIDLFSESWAKCFLHQYSCLLAQIVDAPEQRVGSYSLVTAEARELLPDPTAVIDDPPQELATETFLSWAEESPAQIAITQGPHKWTYGQLAERANIIGRSLRAAGLKTGDVVAVHGDRSRGLIAAVLGTFMSGGVLLLIDPQLPDQRKQLIIKEGRARWILFVGDGERDWTKAEQRIDSLSIEAATGAIIDFDRSEDLKAVSLPKLSSDDHAYIFFTSGTTGIPKGVLGCHKGLSHFLNWQRNTFAITPSDRVAQLTNLSFDAVLRDIFLPLTSGATLCLPETTADRTTYDTIGWLQRERISVLHTVPSLAETWLVSTVQPSSLPSLRWVFFAGEPLTDSLVSQWRSRLQSKTEIVNLYGPTETTLVKCFYRVPANPRSGVQPVGLPITGAQSLVLSHDGQLCGINEPGEIVLRTPFRCLGYLNAPEETQKRFVQNPFREDPDDLVYFTGDAGRYRPDGTLEILGRFDDQVKIRGVRVEPAEVTAILLQHPAVTSCVVVGRRNECGETCLVAYAVTSEPNSLTPGQLRSYLLDRLPSPMVPSTFVFLNVLPLTPNGKVDRKALPEPAYRKPEAENGFVAPRNRLEKTIADIWAEVLKIERIGVHDNFFEAGGHSLLAVRVLSRVMQALQLNLLLKILFEFPTVAHLAKVIEQKRAQMMAGDLEQLLRELETMPEKDAQQVLANESVCR